MTVIASSQATLAAGAAGSWFTPAGASFIADVDTVGGEVRIETTRASSDAAVKAVRFGPSNPDNSITGAQSLQVASVAGRKYRFNNVGAVSCAVAADE